MPLKSTVNRNAEAPVPFSPGLFKSRNNESVWLITCSAPPSILMPGLTPPSGYLGVLVSSQPGSGYPIGHMQNAIDMKNFEPFYGSITLEQTR